MGQRFPFTVFGGGRSGAGSATTDTSGRPSASGLKPGTSASLFNVTAGGGAVETVTVDAQGKATFTTVKQPGQSYVIDGTARLDAGPGQVVAPAAPTMTLTAGNGQVSIAWTDGSNGGSAITSHGLYRGTTSGNLQLVGFITSGSPYVDTGLNNGTPYIYQLSAKNGAGESVRTAEATATPAAAGATPILRLIVWGQSNAQAAGSMTTANSGPNAAQVMPNGYTGPNPRVKIWTTSNVFATYQPYVNSCDAFEAWGSEWAVAQAWLNDNPTGNVYIVKHAIGATGLAVGSTGGGGAVWAPSAGQLYATLTNKVTASAAAAAAQGIIFTVANTVVLQSQGEQDATAQTYADAYQTNNTNFIAQARTDWGASRWIIERLHFENGSQGRPGWTTVYNAQTAIVAADNAVELVSTDALPLYDEVHFSLASLNEKARRSADVITRWWTKGVWAGLTYIADNTGDRYIRATTPGDLTTRKATVPTDVLTVSATSSAQRTYIDSGGLRKTMATTNSPRFTFGDDGVRRLLHEGLAANACLYSRDLTNAVWVASGITPLKDQTGRDGVASSCSRITATAANGTIIQAITAASANRVSSVDVKRLVGTGTLEMTQDGTTWTVLTVTAGWTRVPIPAQTALTNPSVGFRIATSGDSFAIDVVQCEVGLFATSPIYTVGNVATRALEKVAMGGSDWSGAAGTMVYRGRNAVSTAGQFIGGDSAVGLIQRQASATQAQSNNDAQTAKVLATAGAGSFTGLFGVALSFDATGRRLVFNGGAVASDVNLAASRTAAPSIGAASNTNATTATGGACDLVAWGPNATNDNTVFQALGVANA